LKKDQSYIPIQTSKFPDFQNFRKYLTFPRGSFKLIFLGFSDLTFPRGSFKLEILKKSPNLSLKLPLGKTNYFLKFGNLDNFEI